MAFTPRKKEISAAISETVEKDLPVQSTSMLRVDLPKKIEENKVVTTYKLKEKNKKKLVRLAKENGYATSTSAFLDDLIENIPD